MTEQVEAMFSDTPEGAQVLSLIEALKEGATLVVDTLTAFPDRFDNPALHDEAVTVSQVALREFLATLKTASEKRVAYRRQ